MVTDILSVIAIKIPNSPFADLVEGEKTHVVAIIEFPPMVVAKDLTFSGTI